MMEFRCINRSDNTSDAFDYRSSKRRSDVERTYDWKVVSCRWSVGETGKQVRIGDNVDVADVMTRSRV
jgi:hypothetical protein